jgi:hypothetical protein
VIQVLDLPLNSPRAYEQVHHGSESIQTSIYLITIVGFSVYLPMSMLAKEFITWAVSAICLALQVYTMLYEQVQICSMHTYKCRDYLRSD